MPSSVPMTHSLSLLRSSVAATSRMVSSPLYMATIVHPSGMSMSMTVFPMTFCPFSIRNVTTHMPLMLSLSKVVAFSRVAILMIFSAVMLSGETRRSTLFISTVM